MSAAASGEREGSGRVVPTHPLPDELQNVSKHLNLLQQADIVARRKHGNYAYYRIKDETVFALCEAVCGALQNRYDGLHRISETRTAGRVAAARLA